MLHYQKFHAADFPSYLDPTGSADEDQDGEDSAAGDFSRSDPSDDAVEVEDVDDGDNEEFDSEHDGGEVKADDLGRNLKHTAPEVGISFGDDTGGAGDIKWGGEVLPWTGMALAGLATGLVARWRSWTRLRLEPRLANPSAPKRWRLLLCRPTVLLLKAALRQLASTVSTTMSLGALGGSTAWLTR